MSAVGSFDPDGDGAVDRLSEEYEPKFDVDYAVGKQGELFVMSLIRSLGTERIEVKTDEKAGRYRNAYIEFECRGRPSGIRTTASEFWAFVFPGDVALIAKTSAVRDLFIDALARGKTRQLLRGSHPTQGAVVPLTHLLAKLVKDESA
jgi:hypothetical protein